MANILKFQNLVLAKTKHSVTDVKSRDSLHHRLHKASDAERLYGLLTKSSLEVLPVENETVILWKSFRRVRLNCD